MSQRAALKTESAEVKAEAVPVRRNIKKQEEGETKDDEVNTKPVPKPREANK